MRYKKNITIEHKVLTKLLCYLIFVSLLLVLFPLIVVPTVRADFVVDAGGPYQGIVNSPLQFSGSVSGGVPPYSWIWLFGNGDTSYEQNPLYSNYNTPAEYSVTLMVSDSDSPPNSGSDTTSATIYQGSEVYVDDGNADPPWIGTPADPYLLIQDGIDGVFPSGIVHVASGLYDENIVINKHINLVGQDRETTFIDGGGTGSVIDIGQNQVNISNFTIQNSGNLGQDAGMKILSDYNNIVNNEISSNGNFGIYLNFSSNNTILNNSINDNQQNSIFLNFSDDNTINNNTIYNNDVGVYLENSSRNSMKNNSFNHHSYWGIFLYRSISNTIENNSLNHSSCGIYNYVYSNFTTIKNNTVSNTSYGILLEVIRNTTINNNSIRNSSDYGILLHNGLNTTINGNSISNCTRGVVLQYSLPFAPSFYNVVRNNTFTSTGIYLIGETRDHFTDNTIENNTINNTPIRFYKNTNDIIVPDDTSEVILANCTNITIHDLTLENVADGIQLGFSSNNSIYNNTINNNLDGFNIVLTNSSYNLLSQNTITGGYYGIFSKGSLFNTISQNRINQTTMGISLVMSSYNTTIIENSLTENEWDGIHLGTVSNITIVKNTIANNSEDGLYLGFSSNISVIGNFINDNDWDGLSLRGSNNTIRNNTILRNTAGIMLSDGACDNYIQNNTLSKNEEEGIRLDDSHDNTLIENNVTENNHGIYLSQANKNSIIDNGISNNDWYGIWFYSSNETTCVYNDFIDNVHYGTYLNEFSTNNVFYHNNYKNGAFNNAYSNVINIWDDGYPLGGNFWDDHPEFIDEYSGPGQDIPGADGICDTPYYIYEPVNIDNYPFITEDGWNNPPLMPDIPSPENGTSGKPINIDLSWTGGDPDEYDSVTYDVYFGTTNPPLKIESNQTSTVYDPGSLSYETTYYWKIVAWDEDLRSTTSDLWWFITASLPSGGGSDPVSEEDTFPSISNIHQNPTIITYSNTIEISATVTDDQSLASVTLFWDDNSLHSAAMVLTDSTYSATIGPFPEFTTVIYWITATDNTSQTTRSSNYTFTIIDTSGPTITIVSPPAETTIYNTSPIIRATYEDPSGINTHTILFTLDEQNITGLSSITTSSITYQSRNLSFGQHKIQLQVADLLGHVTMTRWSFTVAPSSFIVEESIGNVTAGENNTIIPESTEETIIESVQIRTKTNISNVTLVIVKLIDKPVEVKNTSSNFTIFAFLDVALLADGTPISDADIESITLSFKVEQQWITDQNINKNKISLMRYHNSEWQLLPTIFINEDGSYVYFEAVSLGLSTFAVVGSQVVEINPYQSGMPEIPWIVIIGVVIAATILLIVILFKAGYIYREEDISEKPKEPPVKPPKQEQP